VKFHTGRHITNVGTTGSAGRELITYKYLNWLVRWTNNAVARFSLSALPSMLQSLFQQFMPSLSSSTWTEVPGDPISPLSHLMKPTSSLFFLNLHSLDSSRHLRIYTAYSSSDACMVVCDHIMPFITVSFNSYHKHKRFNL
jgi:hypothetical protein